MDNSSFSSQENKEKQPVTINFTVTPREFFLQCLYNEVSATSLFFVSCIAVALTYFFFYPKIPQGDYFMLSILVAHNFFKWLSWIGLTVILFNLLRIFSKNSNFKGSKCVLRANENSFTFKSDSEEHNYEYKYINRILSTWTSFVVEVDSIPRFVIPRRSISKEEETLIFSFPDAKKKIHNSYVLIVVILIYFLATFYYFSFRDHKNYFIDYRSHSFRAVLIESTMFIQSGRSASLSFDSYSSRMFYDFKDDSSLQGSFQESFFWVFYQGNIKKIIIPSGESYRTDLEHEGNIYFMSYQKDKKLLYRWDRDKLDFIQEPETLIKEIMRKKRAEMRKNIELNEDVETENNFTTDYEILGRNKLSGEKTISIGDESYTIKIEKKPIEENIDAVNYKLDVNWTSKEKAKNNELLNFIEGKQEVSEKEYISILENAGSSFEKY